MFITFRCPCARKLVVKEEFIGKRCVCPECGVKSVVPERSIEEPAARPAKVARPTAPPAETRTQLPPRRQPVADKVDPPRRPVVDEDEAPRKRRVVDEDEAPRKRRVADEDEAPRRPVTAISDAPRKRAAPAVDLDEDEDEAPRPRRGKKSRRDSGGSNTMILVIVLISVVGLLLLGGGGFAIWYFGFRSSAKSADQASSSSSKSDAKSSDRPAVVLDEDIKKIPDDAIGFVSLDAAAFLGTDIGKQVMPLLQGLEQPLSENTGMHLSDFRRCTLIMGADPDKQVCGLISSREPIPANVLATLSGPKFPRIQFQGKTYMKVEGGSANTALYLFPDNRTLLAGPVEGVHWVATASPSSDKGPLASARPQASKHLLVGALNLDTPKIREGIQSAPPEMKQKCSNLLQARTAILTLDLGSEVRLHVSLKLPNETVARAALGEAEELRGLAMKELTKAKQQGAPQLPPQAKQGFDQAASALQGMKLAQTGDTINLDLAFDANLGAGGLPGLVQGPGLGFPFPGANAPQASRTSNDLKQLVLAYHCYLDANQRPPQKPDDLGPYIENDARLLAALKSGQLVFIFGVGLTDMPAGSSNTVVAYGGTCPPRAASSAWATALVRKMTRTNSARRLLAKRK